MLHPKFGPSLLVLLLGTLACAGPLGAVQTAAANPEAVAPVMVELEAGTGGLRAVTGAEIDALFVDLDAEDSPGCALLVLHEGEVLYGRGYGMANLEYGIPIDTRSSFRIGSTSKQFTAACALLAEQQGLLDLDDTVGQWFPELGAVHAPVTLRQLMHHTGGVRDYLSLLELSGRSADDDISLAELLALIGRQEALDFTPGERMSYSNSGYLILAEAVARASGQSLAAFADEHIFEPLGMHDTSYCDDATALVPRRAEGHSWRRDGWHIGRTSLSVVGDGGVFTSVEDLAKWDAHFYGGLVGGEDFLAAQHASGVLSDGTRTGYAAGLDVSEHRGLPLVSHGGAFTGFRAELVRFPEQHLSVICLANIDRYDPTRACLAVADLYLADLVDPSDGPQQPEGARRARDRQATDEPALPIPDGLIGRYHSRELDVEVALELRDDGVWYVLPFDAWGPFRVTEADHLGNDGVDLALTRDDDLAIVGFQLSLGRASGIVFERLQP